MAKRLRHVIGTDGNWRFTITGKLLDGTTGPKNLTGSFVYFEIERDGVQVIAKDNDGVGGVTIFDAVNGIVDAKIEHTDLSSDTGGEADYGVLVRTDPGGADDRDEAIRGKIEILVELVDVP